MNNVSIATLSLSVLYLVFCYAQFGLTKSISETYYALSGYKRSHLFAVFCSVVAGGAIFQSLYDYKDATEGVLMLAGVFMFAVGIAATYRDKGVTTFHYVFAALAIILGFLALFLEYRGEWRSWMPVSVFVVSIPVVRWVWPDYVTYIIEVIALGLIFGCL